MPYNPALYFPQNYAPQYPQYPQQPVQQPRVIEVVPVDTVEEGAKIQVQVGSSVLAYARDDSFILVKSVGMSGDAINIYDRRPPAPPAPQFDPSVYVRKDEVAELVAAAIAAQNGEAP